MVSSNGMIFCWRLYASLLIYFSSLALTSYLYEECKDNTGKEFLVLFLDNPRTGYPMQLSMATPLQKKVRVRIQTPIWTSTEKVDITTVVIPGVQENVNLPETLRMNRKSKQEDKSVLITAEDVIVVFATNMEDVTGDSFLVYPIDTLGKQYVAIGYTTAKSGRQSQFGCVAVMNSTVVEINAPNSNVLEYEENPYTSLSILLNMYDAFQVDGVDTTGAIIKSNNNLACFSGANYASVDINGTSADHIVEQLLPVESWANDYIIVANPIYRAELGEYIRIVTIQNGTEIDITMEDDTRSIINYKVILNRGSFYEFFLRPGSIASVRSQDVISVGQISCSRSIAAALGDPRIIMSISEDHFLPEYTFVTPCVNLTGEHIFGLVIIAENEVINDLTLDNVNISAIFTFDNSEFFGYSVGVTTLSIGVHVLKSDVKGRFSGYVYGYYRPGELGTMIGRNLLSSEEMALKVAVPDDLTETIRNSQFILKAFDTVPSGNAVQTFTAISRIACLQSCLQYSNCQLVALDQGQTNIKCLLYGPSASCDTLNLSTGFTLYAKVY